MLVFNVIILGACIVGFLDPLINGTRYCQPPGWHCMKHAGDTLTDD